MSQTVIEHVLSRLREIGIKDVFGVAGDFAFPIDDAVCSGEDMRWIGGCNELNAAYAADGYARIHGMAALCTTCGVGELSAINDLARWHYHELPEALGCDGWLTARVTTCGELDDVIKKAESCSTGAYIEVITDRYAASALSQKLEEIARLKGARAIAIAGGPEKCAWLTDELGYHAAIDHRAGNVRAAVREAAPNGVDVYFDNVGGAILEGMLIEMANRGRIVCCGSVSTYDGPAPAAGPRGVPGLLVTKRMTMAGFIVSDFAARRVEPLAELHGWVESGALKVPEHITEGLEGLPEALVGLLAGGNRGKRIVKL